MGWHATTASQAEPSRSHSVHGDNILHPSKVVRNLGVYTDEHLSMDTNACHCAKTCFFHLRQIRQLCRYIDYDTLYTLIHALILSRLDYSNSLFACNSQSTLSSLQRVQLRRCW